MPFYNKLVRNKQLKIFDGKGIRYKATTLTGHMYLKALETKLCEEMNEFYEVCNTKGVTPERQREVDADYIEELADILTVVESLAEAKGVDINKLYQAANEKDRHKGRFTDGIYLIRTWVESDPDYANHEISGASSRDSNTEAEKFNGFGRIKIPFQHDIKYRRIFNPQIDWPQIELSEIGSEQSESAGTQGEQAQAHTDSKATTGEGEAGGA